MSININVHGNTMSRLVLADPERCRREELQRRKLLRLEQVRQQSKDIASQLRTRVAEERKRQIDRIDQIKADEVRAWKEKYLGIMDEKLEECYGKVGDAHAAAKAEIEMEKKRLELQKINRRLAAQRGREAMAKLESDKQKQAKPARKPPVTGKRPVSRKSDPVTVATQVGESLNEMEIVKDTNKLIRSHSMQNISSDTLSSSIEVAIQSLRLAKSQPDSVLPIADANHIDEVPLPGSALNKTNYQDAQITLATNLISKRRQTNSTIGTLLGMPDPAIPNDVPHNPSNYANRNASSNIQPQNEFPKDIQPTLPRPSQPPIANRKSIAANPKPRTLSPSKQSTNIPTNLSKTTSSELPARPPTYVPMFTKPSSTQLLVQGHSIGPGVAAIRHPTNASQMPTIAESTVESAAPKVQYYDHANRFSKEYEPDERLIVQPEVYDRFTPDARQAANIERRRELEYAADEQRRRQRSDQRGQIALERERVRKDYDLMNAQLDTLSKQQEYTRTFVQPAHDYAEERLKQMALDRQSAMNKLVEDVLPAAKVQITCPRIVRSQSTIESDGLNVADLERPARPTASRVHGPQSDDSCASIILGEIVNVPKSVQHEAQASKPPARDAINFVHVLDKENGETTQLAAERKRIEKRERDVKNKERKLEEKLLKMFQESQRSAAAPGTSVRVQTDKCLEKDVRIVQGETQDAPVQIIIQVNGGTKHITDTNSNANPSKPSKTKRVAPLRDTSSQVFPKTPLKPMISENLPPADGSSTSTAYQSLPKVIRTQLTDVLTPKEKPNQTSNIASSTLQQYIRRLLGMSRASIDQLEVSDVSTISTPSSSLINITSNVSHVVNPINDQHLNQLQTFIKDNQNFITDLEKSLREISMSSDEASNLRAVETAWMETLAQKEHQMKIGKNVKKRAADKTPAEIPPAAIKPILKKPASPKKVQVVESESRVNLAKSKKVDQPADRIESQTQRCNQRIADLNEMIVKVRREKQRLLESTYSSMGSSMSDQAQNSTEYLEIGRKVPEECDNGSSRTTPDLPSLSEERKQQEAAGEQSSLAASKQIGVSRDSGLGGTSRPMTASDAPVNSPEIRSSNMINTDEESEHNQEPSKYVAITVEPVESHSQKRKPPPSSLQRFGPQIEQLQLGHDLSTIIEVDTPIATSRLNTSQSEAKGNASAIASSGLNPSQSEANRIATVEQNEAKLHQLLLEISSNTRNNLRIANFPYEPSAGNVTVSSTHSNSNAMPMQIPPFPSHASFADGVSGLVDTLSILAENDAEQRLRPANMQPFVSHQQFARDTSGLCTSQSVAAGLDEDQNSFPDVEAELRKRNLWQHSMESVYADAKDEVVETKAKPSKMPTYSTSSSDNLEQEMQKLGINWASSMIKKNKIVSTQALTTSSSSNEDEILEQIKSLSPNPATANSSANASNKSPGKPLNLKEFLARELLKRSNSLSSSSSVCDDSTLASQFLRSLMGSSSDNSSKRSVAGLVYTSERHRTSTPVKDVRPSTPGRPPMMPIEETDTSRSKSIAYHMFSGESGLSSVRGSTVTSSDKEETTTSRDASNNGGGSQQLKMPSAQLRSGTNSSSS